MKKEAITKHQIFFEKNYNALVKQENTNYNLETNMVTFILYKFKKEWSDTKVFAF